MSFNKITIVGNLGRDPELRYTPQGNAVCNISVASSEKKRDKNGELQDITTWFRVTFWGKQAETVSKYFTKGNPIYVEGRLRVEEWTDKDGKGRYTLEVNGTDMQFISGGARSDELTHSGGGSDDSFPDDREIAKSAAVAPSDDDIPF